MFRQRTAVAAISILAVLIAVAAGGSMLWAANHTEPEFEQAFSPLYREFDPAALAPPGSTPEEVSRTGSWNTATLRGSYEFHGVLKSGGEPISPTDVFESIDRAVNAVTMSSHVEGMNPHLPVHPDAQVPQSVKNGRSPSWTLWMYNWGEGQKLSRHGELHIWLFPYPNGDLGFAVHHEEEPLR